MYRYRHRYRYRYMYMHMCVYIYNIIAVAIASLSSVNSSNEASTIGALADRISGGIAPRLSADVVRSADKTYVIYSLDVQTISVETDYHTGRFNYDVLDLSNRTSNDDTLCALSATRIRVSFLHLHRYANKATSDCLRTNSVSDSGLLR